MFSFQQIWCQSCNFVYFLYRSAWAVYMHWLAGEMEKATPVTDHSLSVFLEITSHIYILFKTTKHEKTWAERYIVTLLEWITLKICVTYFWGGGGGLSRLYRNHIKCWKCSFLTEKQRRFIILSNSCDPFSQNCRTIVSLLLLISLLFFLSITLNWNQQNLMMYIVSQTVWKQTYRKSKTTCLTFGQAI